MFFDVQYKAMRDLRIQTDEGSFTIMRAYGKSMYMQTLESPTPGIKVEWKKAFLGGKNSLIIKQFVAGNREVIVNFVNIFGNYYIYFNQGVLT